MLKRPKWANGKLAWFLLYYDALYVQLRIADETIF